jgi:hypothetical protein
MRHAKRRALHRFVLSCWIKTADGEGWKRYIQKRSIVSRNRPRAPLMRIGVNSGDKVFGAQLECVPQGRRSA